EVAPRAHPGEVERHGAPGAQLPRLGMDEDGVERGTRVGCVGVEGEDAVADIVHGEALGAGRRVHDRRGGRARERRARRHLARAARAIGEHTEPPERQALDRERPAARATRSAGASRWSVPCGAPLPRPSRARRARARSAPSAPYSGCSTVTLARAASAPSGPAALAERLAVPATGWPRRGPSRVRSA